MIKYRRNLKIIDYSDWTLKIEEMVGYFGLYFCPENEPPLLKMPTAKNKEKLVFGSNSNKKGSEKSKARKQSKRIKQAEDSINGFKLTVRLLVSAFSHCLNTTWRHTRQFWFSSPSQTAFLSNENLYCGHVGVCVHTFPCYRYSH